MFNKILEELKKLVGPNKDSPGRLRVCARDCWVNRPLKGHSVDTEACVSASWGNRWKRLIWIKTIKKWQFTCKVTVCSTIAHTMIPLSDRDDALVNPTTSKAITRSKLFKETRILATHLETALPRSIANVFEWVNLCLHVPHALSSTWRRFHLCGREKQKPFIISVFIFKDFNHHFINFNVSTLNSINQSILSCILQIKPKNLYPPSVWTIPQVHVAIPWDLS